MQFCYQKFIQKKKKKIFEEKKNIFLKSEKFKDFIINFREKEKILKNLDFENFLKLNNFKLEEKNNVILKLLHNLRKRDFFLKEKNCEIKKKNFEIEKLVKEKNFKIRKLFSDLKKKDNLILEQKNQFEKILKENCEIELLLKNKKNFFKENFQKNKKNFFEENLTNFEFEKNGRNITNEKILNELKIKQIIIDEKNEKIETNLKIKKKNENLIKSKNLEIENFLKEKKNMKI